MNEVEAIVLGLVQGLTEYLPVSSSGHLAVGAEIMGSKNADENLAFTVLVHAATCLSSAIIFRKDILAILSDLLKFKWNAGTKFAAMLLLADIPVIIVGLVVGDRLDKLFDNPVAFIGCMWLLTAALLLLTLKIVNTVHRLRFGNTFLVGIAQAVAALLPGLSRSGTTISVGLMVGIDRAQMAKFSFLMVIPPVLGKILLDMKDMLSGEGGSFDSLSALPATLGFTTAFLVGLLACKAMVGIVQRGKVHYFAFYCIAAGITAILFGTGILHF